MKVKDVIENVVFGTAISIIGCDETIISEFIQDRRVSHGKEFYDADVDSIFIEEVLRNSTVSPVLAIKIVEEDD